LPGHQAKQPLRREKRTLGDTQQLISGEYIGHHFAKYETLPRRSKHAFATGTREKKGNVRKIRSEDRAKSGVGSGGRRGKPLRLPDTARGRLGSTWQASSCRSRVRMESTGFASSILRPKKTPEPRFDTRGIRCE
jgi:hypothetical protein